MPEVIKTVSSDQELRKEPNVASDRELKANGDPVEIRAGEKVKTGTGTKPDADETRPDGQVIRWIWVEALDGKRKGFVSGKFLVGEPGEKDAPAEPIEVSAGFQPLPLEVAKSDFATTCYTQAAQIETNPAYLFALAWTQSGSQWTKELVKSTDPADATAFGIFQFTKATWEKLRTDPDAVLEADDIQFPALQCIAAAVLAAKSASLLKGLIPDRGLSAVDLYLAHLFADDNAFGSQSVDKILQAEKQDKTQKVKGLLEQLIPNENARSAFLKRNGDIFDKDSPSVEEVLKRCTAKLDEGFNQVRGLAPAIDARIPRAGASALGGTVIQVSDRDVEALARVAHSEVGNFGRYGVPELTDALAAVVDTIFVRSIYPTKEFPKSIQGVINQKQQFSAINPLGTWERLPEATKQNRDIVLSHVQARAKGAPSKIKGATHFFNPFTSNPSWGGPIRANPIAHYGRDADKNTHIHGFPTGYRPPGDYAIQFGNDAFAFAGDGQPKAQFSAPDKSTSSVIAAALAEWETWGKSKRPGKIAHIDNESAFATYVRDTYCKPLAASPPLADIQNDKYPWSAVAISYMIRQAGLSEAEFKFAQSHSVYIREAIKARKDNNKSKAFWGYRIGEPEAVLAPGDIVGAGRAEGMTPAQAQALFDRTDDYSSHSDIVVAVRAGAADLIGGNVSDSVTMTTMALDPSGKIVAGKNLSFVVMKRNK